jgi:hypothetical protein
VTRKRDWWDKLAAGPIVGAAGGMARCPRLVMHLGLELLDVAAAMETGDYYREGPQAAGESIDHHSPAFWD